MATKGSVGRRVRKKGKEHVAPQTGEKTHEVGVGKEVDEDAVTPMAQGRQQHLHEHGEFLRTPRLLRNAFHV